ncbi:tRNA modification GTPase GTPBP3, mitochondrial [Neolecta irregularis DAH-3]|uniref:tRNA modification GTPase GTPBP3, mitochondrial n=1 Tax=Neolecta irregularis (strain DAH-3) TaxID=1198029 RepID=A0A1U7LHH5_NEOID|nr:tRNA modification GTPase GTPBP3, mitochondrial [Neolecta irregularis DAH-3]|eukprot:OLL22110.1 tRNA modification GTPase GTPBP3, mitochondrial [Neolecta irregularis DAH-3]
MHFIGNLAIILFDGDIDEQLAYSPGYTILSFFVPICVLLLAFFLIPSGEKKSVVRMTIGGTFGGLAIVGMHYLGQEGISNYKSVYQPANVIGSASNLVRVISDPLAVFFSLRSKWADQLWKRVICAMVLAGAVSGMHWTAAIGGSLSRKTTAIFVGVIVRSVAACVLLLASTFAATRRAQARKDRAQKVVLAAAVFTPDGLVMVTTDGIFPSKEITDQYHERSLDDDFNTSHSVFHWIYRASFNWAGIQDLIPGMRSHLKSLEHMKETEIDYDIAFREMFCVAAQDLANDMHESLENIGVIYDEIIQTGKTKSKNSKGSVGKDPEAAFPYFGKGQFLFLVRHVNKNELSKLSAAGYRFVDANVIVPEISRSMQISQESAIDHINLMKNYLGLDQSLAPGVYLGLFALRANVQRGFKVLVHEDKRHLVPAVRLPFALLEPSQVKCLESYHGFTVSAILRDLRQTLTVKDIGLQQFKSHIHTAILSLDQQVGEPSFNDAILLSECIRVPCHHWSYPDQFATLILLRVIMPIHSRMNPSSHLMFTPLSLFIAQQRVFQGPSTYAAFTRQAHREFSGAAQLVDPSSEKNWGRKASTIGTLKHESVAPATQNLVSGIMVSQSVNMSVEENNQNSEIQVVEPANDVAAMGGNEEEESYLEGIVTHLMMFGCVIFRSPLIDPYCQRSKINQIALGEGFMNRALLFRLSTTNRSSQWPLNHANHYGKSRRFVQQSLSTDFTTIYALSTPPGRSAISVIRISGPRTREIINQMTHSIPSPRFAALRKIHHPKTKILLDSCLLLYFQAPHSFTGQDMFELHIHGGRGVQRAVLDAISCIDNTRYAQPGEFTELAFENEKMDLTTAEGINDLINAETEEQRRSAVRLAGGELLNLYESWRGQIIKARGLVEAIIDFGEDEEIDEGSYELGEARSIAKSLRENLESHLTSSLKGEILRSGIHVALLGPPNAGKSSLLNTLAGRSASIVSSIAGTTRDIVDVTLDVGGYPVIVGDTAGLRKSHDEIEMEGIRRAVERAENSDLKICVVPAGEEITIHLKNQISNAREEQKVVLAVNKVDSMPMDDGMRSQYMHKTGLDAKMIFGLSCTTKEGIEAFLEGLMEIFKEMTFTGDQVVATQERHRVLLRNCIASLDSFLAGDTQDVVINAEDLRIAADALGRISGRVDSEEVLGEIFRSFCIGNQNDIESLHSYSSNDSTTSEQLEAIPEPTNPLLNREDHFVTLELEGNSSDYRGSLDWLDQLEKSRGGLLNSFLNMANSIIGAGIIGIPYAMRESGIILGIILLITLTIVLDWTIRLLVVTAKLSGKSSYQDIVAHCFGRTGFIVVSVAQFAFAFGGMCAFSVIAGDTFPNVLAALFPTLKTVPVLKVLVNREFMIILSTSCTSWPLSLHGDVSKLSAASGAALISMIIIIITVCLEGPIVPQPYKGVESYALFETNLDVFRAIGVISFAFVCHHNSFLIYGSLKKPTIDRFFLVTHLSTGLSLLACLVMGISGYLSFHEKTSGNILNNFPEGSEAPFLVSFARLCFGFNCITTFALECLVCREVFSNIYYPTALLSKSRHFLVTTALVFFPVLISLFTSDLGIVLDITGSTSAVALAFVLPPSCYIHLSSGNWKTTPRKWPAIACVVFGLEY